MQTFSPERTITRARKVLPEGGWEALSVEQRRLAMRAAWVMVEADGEASGDERTALDHIARLLHLGPDAAACGITKSDHDAVVKDLRESPRDRSFAAHLFAALYLVGMSDGVLLDTERKFLDQVVRAIGIDPTTCMALESDLHGILYEELLETVFRDGVVSARERQILNATRKLLGITEQSATSIEEAFRERTTRDVTNNWAY